jgi:hypothetical protein
MASHAAQNQPWKCADLQHAQPGYEHAWPAYRKEPHNTVTAVRVPVNAGEFANALRTPGADPLPAAMQVSLFAWALQLFIAISMWARVVEARFAKEFACYSEELRPFREQATSMQYTAARPETLASTQWHSVARTPLSVIRLTSQCTLYYSSSRALALAALAALHMAYALPCRHSASVERLSTDCLQLRPSVALPAGGQRGTAVLCATAVHHSIVSRCCSVARMSCW